MARLSDKCRNAALQNPKNCLTKAEADAEAACAKEKGMAYGNCMTVKTEEFMVTRCGSIVCPGDPFMIEAEGAPTSSQVSYENVTDGGMFTTFEQDLISSQDLNAPASSSQGAKIKDVKTYILVGIAALAVLLVATSGKKK